MIAYDDAEGLALDQALSEAMQQAFAANARARVSGHRKAELRASYKAALAKRMLERRAGGSSVAESRAYAEGCDEVRELAMRVECAEADYDSDREEVNLRKREADIIREQIGRDYAQARFTA